MSTSLAHLAFEIDNGYRFAPFKVGEKIWHIHRLHPNVPFEVGRRGKTASESYCFFRDPIERFESLFLNRVARKHPSLSPQWERAQSKGLDPNPTFECFIRRFEEYRSELPDISHHALPQTHFIGTDPYFYDRIFRPESLDNFEELLSERLGRVVKVPHEQSSGQGVRPSWTEAGMRKVKKIYAKDYKFQKKMEGREA